MAKLKSTKIEWIDGYIEKLVSIEMTIDELEEIIDWGEFKDSDFGGISHNLLDDLKDILEKNK